MSSPASAPSRLYFDNVPAPLLAVMDRVGAQVSPGEFIQGVIEVFQEVWHAPEAEMRLRFRRSRAHQDFRSQLIKAQLAPNPRILAVGTSFGFGGRNSGYASEIIHEVYDGLQKIEVQRLDITPRLLSSRNTVDPPRRQYSMVVTHSVLRYMFEVKWLLELLDSFLAPGGKYLMANEPNGRFWRNRECLNELQRKEESDRRRKRALQAVNPQRYLGKAVRLMRGGNAVESFALMNRMLRGRFGLRDDLKFEEIVHINEPNLPDVTPGVLRLGSNGLDWEELQASFPSRLCVESVRTSGYLGRDNPVSLRGKWREVDQMMAARFPLDGCSFSVLWWKPKT